MPYSQINGERALFTQINNVSMCLNLLWGIKELKKECRLIITTTTGIPGQAYSVIPECYTLNKAGSWYHVSRGFDSANCRLASSQFGIEVVEFRTSIVWGLQTDLLKSMQEYTRFDTDPYFGTVVNRFVAQALKGKPITIYGKGRQTKPFINLDDVVESIKNAIEYDFKEKHTILNQVAETISIVELAGIIRKKTKCRVEHIPNPRKEKETHKMLFDNRKFLDVLGRKPKLLKNDLKEMIDAVKGYTQSSSYIEGNGDSLSEYCLSV